jgi:hypothetical protein
MDDIVRVLFILQFLLAGGGIAYMYCFRKPTVTRLDFLAAGPFLYLHPSDYVLPHKVTLPKRMFAACLCLFIITFALIWVPNNLGYGHQ